MTFDPLVPLATDSPSIFPNQAQTNWSRLQTLIAADHQFNNTAASDDGYHNVIHCTQQAPTGALAGIGRRYVKSSAGKINAFYMDDAGTEYQITPTLPIRAAVNFNGVLGFVGIRSQYNVSSVVRDSLGHYTINFTTNMPNTDYIVQITGMRSAVDSILNGCVLSGTYTASVAVGFVKIAFYDQGNSAIDALMGNVTIFSVT